MKKLERDLFMVTLDILRGESEENAAIIDLLTKFRFKQVCSTDESCYWELPISGGHSIVAHMTLDQEPAGFCRDPDGTMHRMDLVRWLTEPATVASVPWVI